jgi:hypothetical protein
MRGTASTPALTVTVVLLGSVSTQPTSTPRLEVAGDAATAPRCADPAPEWPTIPADAGTCSEPESLLLSAGQHVEGSVCVAASRSNRSRMFRMGSLGGDPDATLFEDGFESGSLDAWSRVATQACPSAPTNLMGCPACTAGCNADPWNVSWTTVPGATHYILEYQCSSSIATYETTTTVVDLCHEVGMCEDDDCSFGVAAILVRACDAGCCSPNATFPPNGTPIACGGGLCC